MRPVALLRPAAVCLIVLAAGCSSHNKGRLEYTRWVSNETTLKDKKDKDVTLPEGARVLDFEEGQLTYELTDAEGKKLSLKGTWVCNAGHFVTLKFDEPLNDRKQHVEKIVIEGDQLTMTDSDGTSVTFTGGKKAKK